ncbi:MAG TPA: hypothetical protein VKS78_07995 [Roseiarcus sp.]|nr:hypothetical protein [Roseiarcus sp.]
MTGYHIVASSADLRDNFNHWRKRGEEMRTLAEEMGSLAARDAMLGLADDFDRLAREAEGRANETIRATWDPPPH